MADILGTHRMEEGSKENIKRFDYMHIFKNLCKKLPKLKDKQQTWRNN